MSWSKSGTAGFSSADFLFLELGGCGASGAAHVSGIVSEALDARGFLRGGTVSVVCSILRLRPINEVVADAVEAEEDSKRADELILPWLRLLAPAAWAIRLA